MIYDESGQEDRPPVNLPEIRHHWASNDEVDKPLRDLLRGPVRVRLKSKMDDSSRMSPSAWMTKNLPAIGATAITVIVILCIVVAIYTDMVGVLNR